MFLGEVWGESGCLSVPKGRVLHAVHAMPGAGAGGLQILAPRIGALSGEGREEVSAT